MSTDISQSGEDFVEPPPPASYDELTTPATREPTDEPTIPAAREPTTPAARTRGSIKPHPNFNSDHAEQAAKDFKKAFRGLGTDEYRIINLLTSHSNEQRQVLRKAYKTSFGSDLVKDLIDEVSGDFEDLCVALLTPPVEYDAKSTREAMEGLGTNEVWLVELLCPRTKEDILKLTEEYKKRYHSLLEDDVISETSGVFQKVLVSMCQGSRHQTKESELDKDKVLQDAKDIYDAGEGKLGTDEEVFNTIFSLRSWAHLKAMFEEYQKLSGRDIVESIDREFSFNAKEAFAAIAKYAQDPALYFAWRINQALRGWHESDESLIRLMVSRSEVDMEDIKEAYQKQYRESLVQVIRKETCGDFRKLLVKTVDPSTPFK